VIEIERISGTDEAWEGITVAVGGRLLDLSWRWLRDHSQDETSFHRDAHQRLVTPGIVAAAGQGTATVENDDELVVTWPDGTVARYSTERLAALAPPDVMYLGAPQSSLAWRGDQVPDQLESLTFDEVTKTNGLRRALNGLEQSGVITLTDIPIDNAATRIVLERFGYVRQTIFGDLWEFSSDKSAGDGFDDTASTPLEITPHTDGTYSNDAPGLLGLHCHIYEATGGENVFVDGLALSERIADESLRHHELLRSVEIPGQYIGDGAHLIARRPVLRHENDRLAQISYNHHDRAPFLLPEPLMTEVFDALAHVDEIANDPIMQFELALRPGDMVIFDNWRLLHGRRAFTGARHIAGGYLNREDVDSARRLARAGVSVRPKLTRT
jgi:trimethyllysine dioxygenase